ncbi:hypothetical protein C2R22_15375 [Salinigranum rubrum]|uniref:Uncharacterized protein n=1 Tax=Salinigranum rubrum TaxID=755307 RepID=A0A2I8VLN3_9EURY|nr:hypothetical protein C2R22_15375 [Salinigranum rubrum]
MHDTSLPAGIEGVGTGVLVNYVFETLVHVTCAQRGVGHPRLSRDARFRPTERLSGSSKAAEGRHYLSQRRSVRVEEGS